MNTLIHDPFVSGYQLDQYTLLERIGVGGQASVWSAWDQANSRVIAIKIIVSTEGGTTALPETAMKEAHLVSRLQHPHILPLYDFKFSDDWRYLVMRYVSGGTLHELIAEEPMPVESALLLIRQIASALDYMHAQGIVHRDLKPANVLFDAREHPYLTDFGLAKDLSEAALLLHTGRGTPPYAPPEQHTYSAITPQSDVFSLGVMVYEMVTGKLPWGGETSLAVRQISDAEEMPDPRASNPRLPKSLVEALRIITASNPSERPMSAGAAVWLLEEVFGAEHQTLDADEYQKVDENALIAEDASRLIVRGCSRAERGAYPLNFTQFRFADSVFGCQPDAHLEVASFIPEFLFRGALVHGYNVEYWRGQITDHATAVRLCEDVISRDTPAAGQAITALLKEPFAAISLRSDTAAKLAEIALSAGDPSLRGLAFDALERTYAGSLWRDIAFSESLDRKLAQAALGKSGTAKRTAKLIGRIKSSFAVNTMIQEQHRYRSDVVIDTLLGIQQTAGSLPPHLPTVLRAQISGEALRRELVAQPLQLAKAYGVTALGGLLGFGTHVYLTYRLPQILDSTRILVALQHGVFLGLLVGAGVFTARTIAVRMHSLHWAARAALGAFIGGLIINFSLVAYHLLLLNALPAGGLILLGSIVISAAVALGSTLPIPKIGQAAISASGVIIAMAGTWLLHLQTLLDPILLFDYNWSLAQIFAVIVLTSVLLTSAAHVVPLTHRETVSETQTASAGT